MNELPGSRKINPLNFVRAIADLGSISVSLYRSMY